MNTLQVIVARRRAEAQDIDTFELRRADGAALPPFAAGAHIDVTAPNGIVRQYSLCNSPAERERYLIGVLRDPASRGGSASLHQDLAEGALVRISEPRNHFALAPARHTLLLAAGIGITPLLCMAEELSAAGAGFALHYCARTPARAAFRDRIAMSAFAAQARFHFDDGAPDQRLDLHALFDRPAAGTRSYVCGPAGFIAAARAAAAQHGWPADRVHVEHFGAVPQAPAHTTGFDVRIASSGKVVHVAPGRSVAAALADAGVAIALSCGEGVCGSCITRVLAGIPDHRDAFFTDQERAGNDQFTPCCSGSLSALLVLDL
jgi:vanillate O-demethylase ferredoxin subunit